MSANNQVTPKNTTTTSNSKSSQGSFGLATPQPTPAVEDDRIKADQERMAAAMRQLLEAPSTSPTETSDKEASGAVSDANTQSEEVKTEIERILRCLDSSHAEILGISPNSPEREVVAAWRHLGCLLHPRFLKHPDADAAFKKLRTAARKLGLDDLDIDEVYYWDGEETFDASEPDTTMDVDAVPAPPQRVTNIYQEATPALYRLGQDSSHPAILRQLGRLNTKISEANKIEKIEPGQWTIPISFFGPHYNEVSRRYSILRDDPTNETAREEIIKEKTLIDSFIQKNHFPKQWTILTPDDYLKSRDEEASSSEVKDKAAAADVASIVAADAHNLSETYLQSISEAKNKAVDLDDITKASIEEAEQAIIAEVANALAAREKAKVSAEKASQASSIQKATEALEAAETAATTASEAAKAAGLAAEEASRIVDTAASAVRSSQNSTEYPWTTAQAADGSLIVGVRKQGRFGTQVCIETQENDGRIIRRLESASEVGLLEVQRYWEMDGFKDLAQGQSQWSHKDRNDYDQLLWITKSQTKRKNIAANNKDPNADCCVKFHNKGIEILSVTSLTKVLGPSSARAEIEKVCKRDNILPPWKAGWVSEYSDPSKVEKDSARRRALRDAQATSSTDNRLDQKKYNVDGDKGKENLVVEQLEDRVKSLENEMKDMKSMTAMMNQNMETLMGMFKEFMKAKAGPGLSHF